jgi:hypothetical protein
MRQLKDSGVQVKGVALEEIPVGTPHGVAAGGKGIGCLNAIVHKLLV